MHRACPLRWPHNRACTWVASYDASQLTGETATSDLSSYCSPLMKNGSLFLNPCGLIANTLFNDKITIETSSEDDIDASSLKTTGIAWPSDKRVIKQPDNFAKCRSSVDEAGTCLNSKCSSSVCENGCSDGNAVTSKSSYCKGYYCSEPSYFNCEEGYDIQTTLLPTWHIDAHSYTHTLTR